MSDIFLSYASVDRERIKPLVEALQQCGFRVWWDPTILPGQVWRQVIDEALDAARCVVVVWSQASIASHWVTQEAEDGLQRRILVPLILDQVRIPLGFRGIQAANLVGWNGSTAHPEFDKLVRSIYPDCAVLDAGKLAKIEVPNRNGFIIPNPRPDIS